MPGFTPYEEGRAIYQSRYLSNEGRLFFNSSDGLVPRDVNEQEDVYEFEPVGVGALSGHPCSCGGWVVGVWCLSLLGKLWWVGVWCVGKRVVWG